MHKKAQNTYKRTKIKMAAFYVLKKHLRKKIFCAFCACAWLRLCAFCGFAWLHLFTVFAFCALCACEIFS